MVLYHLCRIIDNWSTPKRESVFVGVGRIAQKTNKFNGRLLYYDEMCGSHTTAAFKKLLEKIFDTEEYANALLQGITTTTDGEAAQTKAASESKFLVAVRCSSHLLSNVINYSLAGKLYPASIWNKV